ncbi:hypothetical protein Tco_0546666 [Tanacetum coccineum]
MTTPITTSTTDSQMHNNIMAAGSRDRPPMLATGRYLQWQSRFLRYIDTRPNGDALRKCILEGPYQPTTVTILAVHAIENSPTVPERTTIETILTMSPENKAHYESEKFTFHDGESIESYYSRFYKMMNEMIKNNLIVATMQVNVQLFDVLKQYQKKVNEIRAERISKNANPLALVVVAQQYLDPYYQAPKSYKSYAPPSKQSSSTRSNASTKYKSKEIAKPITPPSESASKEDSDPEQAQRDKDMQKNLALIAKYFKKIYKPTNNNIITSSNSRNKNVDTSLRETEASQETKKEQADWLEDTDEEINEQELEAH